MATKTDDGDFELSGSKHKKSQAPKPATAPRAPAVDVDDEVPQVAEKPAEQRNDAVEMKRLVALRRSHSDSVILEQLSRKHPQVKALLAERDDLRAQLGKLLT